MEDKICPLLSIRANGIGPYDKLIPCLGSDCAFFFDVRDNYELYTNASAKRYNRCALVGIAQRLDEIQEAVKMFG